MKGEGSMSEVWEINGILFKQKAVLAFDQVGCMLFTNVPWSWNARMLESFRLEKTHKIIKFNH